MVIHLCDIPLVGRYGAWSRTSARRLLPPCHDVSTCQCILALMTSSPPSTLDDVSFTVWNRGPHLGIWISQGGPGVVGRWGKCQRQFQGG